MIPLKIKNILHSFIWILYLNSSLFLIPTLSLSYETVKVILPYQEKDVFLNEFPKACEYSFHLEPGQELSAEIKTFKGLFARLWELGSNKKVKKQLVFPLKEDISSVTDYRYFILELCKQNSNLPFELTILGKLVLLFPIEQNIENARKYYPDYWRPTR